MWQRALSSSGGGGAEHTLWTNPSPTAQISDVITANLSDNISNYDSIRIYYKFKNTDNADDNIYVEVSSAFFSDSTHRIFLGSYNTSTTYFFDRMIEYFTDTSMYINKAWRVGGNVNDGTMSIPTKIVGIK